MAAIYTGSVLQKVIYGYKEIVNLLFIFDFVPTGSLVFKALKFREFPCTRMY